MYTVSREILTSMARTIEELARLDGREQALDTSRGTEYHAFLEGQPGWCIRYNKDNVVESIQLKGTLDIVFDDDSDKFNNKSEDWWEGYLTDR